jgi:archaemetzincin
VRCGLVLLLITTIPYPGLGNMRSDRALAIGHRLRKETLQPPYEALKALHTPLPRADEGDWLAEHDEDGQSFQDYASGPVTRPDEHRRVIHLQPVGDFPPAQQRALQLTADFVRRFFQLPVQTSEPVAGSTIPARARRIHPVWGTRQLWTRYVLEEVLAPRRTPDAFAVLGLTTEDLFPAAGWNFVFGEASMDQRVGVWSTYRNGDPASESDRFLERTIKTAVHELGHMFSMPHCLAYRCVLNGSNHRAESDSRPLELCPVCLQKLAWNIGFDPRKRFIELAEFAQARGWKDLESELVRSKALLPKPER